MSLKAPGTLVQSSWHIELSFSCLRIIKMCHLSTSLSYRNYSIILRVVEALKVFKFLFYSNIPQMYNIEFHALGN